MSDLISRKAVLTTIHNYFRGLIDKGMHEIDVVDCNAELCKEVDNIPVAYDMGKVVEWLEDDRQQALCMADESEYFLGQLALLNRVIPLVKGAVKHESHPQASNHGR